MTVRMVLLKVPKVEVSMEPMESVAFCKEFRTGSMSPLLMELNTPEGLNPPNPPPCMTVRPMGGRGGPTNELQGLILLGGPAIPANPAASAVMNPIEGAFGERLQGLLSASKAS